MCPLPQRRHVQSTSRSLPSLPAIPILTSMHTNDELGRSREGGLDLTTFTPIDNSYEPPGDDVINLMVQISQESRMTGTVQPVPGGSSDFDLYASIPDLRNTYESLPDHVYNQAEENVSQRQACSAEPSDKLEAVPLGSIDGDSYAMVSSRSNIPNLVSVVDITENFSEVKNYETLPNDAFFDLSTTLNLGDVSHAFYDGESYASVSGKDVLNSRSPIGIVDDLSHDNRNQSLPGENAVPNYAESRAKPEVQQFQKESPGEQTYASIPNQSAKSKSLATHAAEYEYSYAAVPDCDLFQNIASSLDTAENFSVDDEYQLVQNDEISTISTESETTEKMNEDFPRRESYSKIPNRLIPSSKVRMVESDTHSSYDTLDQSVADPSQQELHNLQTYASIQNQSATQAPGSDVYSYASIPGLQITENIIPILDLAGNVCYDEAYQSLPHDTVFSGPIESETTAGKTGGDFLRGDSYSKIPNRQIIPSNLHVIERKVELSNDRLNQEFPDPVPLCSGGTHPDLSHTPTEEYFTLEPPDGRSCASVGNGKSPLFGSDDKIIINSPTQDESGLYAYASIPTCTADDDLHLSVVDHSLYQSVDDPLDSYNGQSDSPNSGKTKVVSSPSDEDYAYASVEMTHHDTASTHDSSVKMPSIDNTYQEITDKDLSGSGTYSII